MEMDITVDASLAEVIAWHERPGAIERLLPPWQHLGVRREASSLRSGVAVLSLPGGIHWTATHIESRYSPGHRFVDRLTTPGLRQLIRWEHTHTFDAVSEDRTRVTDRVEARIPDRTLARVLAYRGRQLRDDIASHALMARLGAHPMRVAVTGSSGLIGAALCAFLSTGGHDVVRLVRSQPDGPPRYAEDRVWNPTDPAADLLDGIDAVVHLAGEPIAGRFDEEHKRAVRDSRVASTKALARLVGTRPFVVASGVGIYGFDRGDELLTESSERGDGYLADLAADWEAAADPARESGSRVVHVRTGIVQSPKGGVLQLMRPLFMIGAGGRLGNGTQWTPWIGIDDMVDIYLRSIVDPALSGPVNAVAPNPVRNSDYTRTLAHVMHRPAIIPVPSFGPRLLFGAEAVDEMILAGQRAEPTLLESLGHRFRFPELDGALRHLLGRTEGRTGGADGSSTEPNSTR